jgi:hypothetical protein
MAEGGAEHPPVRIPAIDTSEGRALDASWHNCKLWFAADDLCPSGNDNCFRLAQVDTSNDTLFQDFDIVLPGKNLFYPSLAIDLSGNLGIVFGVSSKNDYSCFHAAIRSVNAPKNKLSSFIPLTHGLATSNANRYGDYFGATIDPISAPLGNATRLGVFWCTFIANFTLPVGRFSSAETTTAVKYALSVPTKPIRETLPNHKNEEFLKAVG